MHIIFVEKVLADESYELTIVEGSKELEKEIDGDIIFPKKLILSKKDKEDNKDGLRDLLTGAFCLQGIKDVTFAVKNEKGEFIGDYSSSLYDDIGPSGMA